MPSVTPIERLRAIMARLRDPNRGCPWDVEQTFATIAPYTLEEAYEVVDAIERRDDAALKDELGDLLLQVVFHAQMAAENGLFDFDDVARAIGDKLVRRHPHVFADAGPRDVADQTRAWEAGKHAERQRRRADATPNTASDHTSVLEDLPLALPALVRAAKLQKRAAGRGFRWPRPSDALAKITEEIQELVYEISSPTSTERITDELGDVLFALVALARTLDIDAETALRHANAKFERRFRRVERLIAVDAAGDLAEVSLPTLLAAWTRVKEMEATDDAEAAANGTGAAPRSSLP